MLTAKCNYDKQGIDCEVEGTTMEIVGELTAIIRAVQEALIKKYDKDAVDETIVNIGRAAYDQKTAGRGKHMQTADRKKKTGGTKT